MSHKNFHEGELRLQEQVGMREKIDVMTEYLMHDFMPDQHREFFEGLEYFFLGTIAEDGLPHTVFLTGPPRFVSSPDPKTLIVQTGPRTGRPGFSGLVLGQSIGVLGLDLSNRRRNRMHGRISALDDTSITVTVVQSYGNCPKYISLRKISERDAPRLNDDAIIRETLQEEDVSLIKASDTFFISSYVQDGSGAAYEGVDVNHRGGAPGFVRVDSPAQITVPDYKGNNLFNTFGNLLLNPDAGVLFIDFETGDQLHLHGQASLIEDAEQASAFPGALRLMQIQIKHVTLTKAATPLRWRFIETSPFNP